MFSLRVEQYENQDGARPIDRKPGTVEETAVAEFSVLYEKQQYFP